MTQSAKQMGKSPANFKEQTLMELGARGKRFEHKDAAEKVEWAEICPNNRVVTVEDVDNLVAKSGGNRAKVVWHGSNFDVKLKRNDVEFREAYSLYLVQKENGVTNKILVSDHLPSKRAAGELYSKIQKLFGDAGSSFIIEEQVDVYDKKGGITERVKHVSVESGAYSIWLKIDDIKRTIPLFNNLTTRTEVADILSRSNLLISEIVVKLDYKVITVTSEALPQVDGIEMEGEFVNKTPRRWQKSL